MSTVSFARPARTGGKNGGTPARRAVIGWAWRMFRREWRQQSLILALIVVAVAATFVGSAVATNTPSPIGATFGSAQDLVTLGGTSARVDAQIAALQRRFGRVDVIENQTIAIPGSIDSYDLRAQNPRGPFGQPMLSLVSGHYPAGPGQVAVTAAVASAFRLHTGSVWHEGGTARQVTGIVSNPLNLLDQFALVTPGQVSAPSQITALFDANGRSVPGNVETRALATPSNLLNPETITLTADTLGLLLIALVAVGGFTVTAQRRLRSLGMLGSMGATDRHIRLVTRANGLVIGVAGTLAGAVIGLAVWLAYRPSVESDAHHEIGVFQLPWAVIGAGMALAVVATFLSAIRPARTVARVPIVTALAGRPSPPKPLHRWAAPAGAIFLVIAFLLLGLAGGTTGPTQQSSGQRDLVFGLVALIVAVVLLSPLLVATLGRAGRRAPIAVRLALRDMARYRARSGSALGAISLGILIAVIICVASAARFGNVLDYAGPNMTSSQLVVYTPNGPGWQPSTPQTGNGPPGRGNQQGPPAVTTAQLGAMAARTRSIKTALDGYDMITLELAGATLQHAEAGRQFSGPLYVATPQLLAAFGIKPDQVDPDADILTMRPGLATTTKMQLTYGSYGPNGPPGGDNSNFPCPRSACLANPVMQTITALPSGTSAPNTVLTEHAVQQLGLHTQVAGWLIQTQHPLTAAQISNTRQTAAAAGMTLETKSSIPSGSEIIDAATLFGILLALGILGMSVGLIRSETASELRTLTATGASSSIRRTLTAATAGALGLLGAVLGTVGGYVAALGFFRTNNLDGLSSLSSIPIKNLLIIVVGMPLAATVIGWLVSGREPATLARQPLE